MGVIKRKAAVLCNVTTLEKEGRLRFWTITTPDEVHDPKEISRRWNVFRTRLLKEFPKLRGLRVYEYHPGGHGIHIHLIVNRYLPAARMWQLAAVCGFGRVDVQEWKSGADDAAAYLTKYITKARGEDWDGTRVYGLFGWKGESTRQRDIEVTTSFGTIWRHLAAIGLFTASMAWGAKVEACEAAHRGWVQSEAADPAAYCAASLVPSRTIQTPYSPYLVDGKFCGEHAADLAALRRELHAWDLEIHEQEWRERGKARWQEEQRRLHERINSRSYKAA